MQLAGQWIKDEEVIAHDVDRKIVTGQFIKRMMVARTCPLAFRIANNTTVSA
jgi:hypothetical protein